MRASGILLPVASLPSRYGIGCFSKEAYTFVDNLKKAAYAETDHIREMVEEIVPTYHPANI